MKFKITTISSEGNKTRSFSKVEDVIEYMKLLKISGVARRNAGINMDFNGDLSVKTPEPEKLRIKSIMFNRKELLQAGGLD